MKDKLNRIKGYYAFLKSKYRSQETDRLNGASFLLEKYGHMLPDSQKNQFKKEEYRVHSQNGEDGILLYIFSKIGTTNKTTVEFGVGNGRQCNSANLILNFGWNGLYMEGNSLDVQEGRNYYKHKGVDSLKIENEFITAENINDLISKHGISGEIDLLNVDIDGNDYWVWKAIDIVKPRVVVVEYNNSFGPEKAFTVPYEPSFNRWEKHETGWYHGASLKALEKLGIEKGYKLVACDSTGVNAFFVQETISTFEHENARTAYYSEYKRVQRGGIWTNQMGKLGQLPLEEV